MFVDTRDIPFSIAGGGGGIVPDVPTVSLFPLWGGHRFSMSLRHPVFRSRGGGSYPDVSAVSVFSS